MTNKPILPYDEIGAEKLSQLIDVFYGNVAKHPKLKPIFPDDLTEIARKQKQFLTQYLGGPNLYTEEHGHPAMKMRHNPFPITPERAVAWLECMRDAMDKTDLDEKFRYNFYRRLELTANHMVNQMSHEEEIL